MNAPADTTTSPKSRKLFGAGMLAAGLVAGAMFSPAGFAGAQDDTTDSETTETERPRDGRRGHRLAVLEELGIDADAIEAGREADQSLVEIAEANGVTEAELVAAIEDQIETRLAAAVENGRITQEEADEKLADLTANVTERINTPPSERPEREGRGGRLAVREALAEVGLTIEDVREGYEAGQTLAETAEANGIDEATLVDAMVAQATERVETGLENGRIDDEKAAELLDGLEERISERVNTEPGERGPRGPRG